MAGMEFKRHEGMDDIFKSTAPTANSQVVLKAAVEEKIVTKLPVDVLVPYKNHPFKLYEGKRLDDLVESVKELGVIVPVVVRKLKDNTYEILSGHNRVNAAKKAGLTEVPVLVKYHLPDDDALLIVTETNLMQRSIADLAHSERARALAVHMEAVKHTGKKRELFNEIKMLSNTDEINENETVGLLVPQGESREKVAEKFDLSGRNISRYLRVDTLVNELKVLVDNEEIPIYAAVDLSFMRPREQSSVATAIASTGHKVDMKIAKALRQKSKVKELGYDAIERIIIGTDTKPVKPKKGKTISFPASRFSDYFSADAKKKEIEDTVIAALEFYFKNHESHAGNDPKGDEEVDVEPERKEAIAPDEQTE